MNLLDLLKVFWISFAASAIVAWPIYRWLKSTVKQKIDPYAPESHQAKQGTPTMGGLIILVGALVAIVCGRSIILGRQADLGFITEWVASQLPSVIVILIGFGLIGFIDDFVVPRRTTKRGLGWKQKLAMELVVAVAALYFALGDHFEPMPVVVGTFAILFYANAFNFVDGLDGLAASVWFGLALGLHFLVGNPILDLATVAITGGAIVFLAFNAPPAKLFMGDVGSLPIGAFLGLCVTILVWQPIGRQNFPLEFDWSWLGPIFIFSLLMIAELVPVPMQVAYFKLTKGRRLFPATPIHHGFEKKGWPESRVMWTFALFQLLLSLAAVTVYKLQLQTPT